MWSVVVVPWARVVAVGLLCVASTLKPLPTTSPWFWAPSHRQTVDRGRGGRQGRGRVEVGVWTREGRGSWLASRGWAAGGTEWRSRVGYGLSGRVGAGA